MIRVMFQTRKITSHLLCLKTQRTIDLSRCKQTRFALPNVDSPGYTEFYPGKTQHEASAHFYDTYADSGEYDEPPDEEIGEQTHPAPSTANWQQTFTRSTFYQQLNMSLQNKQYFCGKEKSNPKAFFTEFDRIARVYGATPQMKLDMIPGYLDAYAKSVMKTVPHASRNNYVAVRSILIDHYRPLDSDAQLHQNFHTRVQGHEECVDSYYFALCEALSEFQPNLPRDSLPFNQIIRTQLKQGLRADIRNEALRAGPTEDLETYLQYAKNAEHYLKFATPAKGALSYLPNAQVSATTHERERDHSRNNRARNTRGDNFARAHVPRDNNFDSRRSRRDSRNAFSRENPQNNSNFTRDESHGRGNRVIDVCTYCFHSGHKIEECRMKRGVEERRGRMQRGSYRSQSLHRNYGSPSFAQNFPQNRPFSQQNFLNRRPVNPVGRNQHENTFIPRFPRNQNFSNSRTNFVQGGFPDFSQLAPNQPPSNSMTAPVPPAPQLAQPPVQFSATTATVATPTANPPLLTQSTAPTRPPDDLSRVLQSLTELKDQMSDLHHRVDQMTDLMANPPSAEVPLAMTTTTVQLPSIAVNLNDVTISALLDTGSQVSLITSEVFTKLGFHIPPNSKSHSGMGVSATPFVIKAYIDLMFQIGNENYKVRTGVTDALPDSVLLGYDFITKNAVLINSEENFAMVEGNQVPLLDVHTKHTLQKSISVLPARSGPTCARISVLNDITVEPLTRVITPAYVAHGKSLPTDVLFEPSQEFCRDKLVSVASSVIEPTSPIFPVSIVNVTKAPISINQGEFVGTLGEIAPKCTTANSARLGLDSDQRAAALYHALNIATKNHCLQQMELNELTTLLVKYGSRFAVAGEPLSRTHLTEFKIDTGNNDPVKTKFYRIEHATRTKMRRILDEMLADNVIEPTTSEWSSPLFLVPKKNGEMRPVVDFRKLNQITKTEVFPIPQMEDYFDALGSSAYFTTLDLKSGYWQVPLDPDSRVKTAFTCPLGNYQFCVLPYGLKNAPIQFQHLMELVLAGLNWQTALVYIDDIVIYSRTFSEHLIAIEKVLAALERAQLQVKPEKCHFAQQKITFLGHIVSSEGIRPDPEKVRDLIEFPAPTCMKDVQRFLGLVTWFRKFIPDLARISRPLYLLLRNNVTFKWTEEHDNAFCTLKNVFTSEPILALPKFTPDWTFVLSTDASDYAIGAILRQEHAESKITRVIAYSSRQLHSAEINYFTTEKEALAIVFATKYFRHYLFGRPFVIETDHQSLTWLMNLKDPSSRLRRWSLKLQEYQYEIRYVPGKRNQAPDVLSRHPKYDHCVPKKYRSKFDFIAVGTQTDFESDQHIECHPVLDPNLDQSDSEYDNDPEEANPPPKPPDPVEDVPRSQQLFQRKANAVDPIEFTQANLRREQSIDEFCSKIIAALNEVAPKNYRDVFFIRDGILFRRFQPKRSNEVTHQIVLPKVFRSLVLEQFHDSLFGGHFSVGKTLPTIQARYWWTGMESDIAAWITTCTQCTQRKLTSPRINTKLKSIEVVAPFELIACDCLTVPTSRSGKTSIVVFMDALTKYPEAFAVSDIKATTIADLLLNEVIPRHGAPRRFLMDQGSNFTSSLVAQICHLLSIQKIFTSPYHPQCDGMVERYNRTLLNTLSKMSSADPAAWERLLPFALFAYRATPQASTGVSPFMLLYGREPFFALDAQVLQGIKFDPDSTVTMERYLANLVDTMQNLQRTAIDNIKVAQQRQADAYNKNVDTRVFNVHDIVYLNNKAPNADFAKFAPKQLGPYRIAELPTAETAKIVLINNPLVKHTVHRARLLAHNPPPFSDLLETKVPFLPNDVVIVKPPRRGYYPAVVVNFADLPASMRYLKNHVPVKLLNKKGTLIPISYDKVFTFTAKAADQLLTDRRPALLAARRQAEALAAAASTTRQ